MSVETDVQLEVRVVNLMPWVCDCQSARMHALASPGGFTAIMPTGECFWCGCTYAQANQRAADRMSDA